MATVKQLKEMIVDLKVELVKARIPQGHCPYAYYKPSNAHKGDCSDCNECSRLFLEEVKADIEKEVWETDLFFVF